MAARRNNRKIRIGAAAPAIAGIVAAIGAVTAGVFLTRRRSSEGHAAPDLALDGPRPGTERAPIAFRPDPTAPVSAADREALRPATGPSQ